MDFIGGEWNSDLLPHFLTGSWVSNELIGAANLQMPSSLWPAPSMNTLPSIDEALFCSSESWSSNLPWEGHFLNANRLFRDSQSSIDLCFDNSRNTDSYYRESEILEKQELKGSESENGLLIDSKKRHRIEANVSKTTNGRSKKRRKMVCSTRNNEEDGSGGRNGQGISDCHSEDDSNASQELPQNSLRLIGKARASRGAATDPQSIYARKRREKINERLRTLQHLVPSGTKVDMSTMLEEAVHYVKFLQLQIKLLSSDEMWMYAPVAYDGMDLELHATKS